MKKWTIENTETLEYEGRTLHRVVLTENCQFGKKGDKMGWIEREENLRENAMVLDNAKIYSNAKVFGNALIYGDAEVSGMAEVYCEALVYNNAKIDGCALIFNNAQIFGDAEVSHEAMVYDRARVCGNAHVCDKVRIGGTAVISDRATISDWAQVYECSRVSGEAVIGGHAKICGKAEVTNKAQVCGETTVSGNAVIFGNARVFDNACVSGYVKVYDHAVVAGNAIVSSYANICKGAVVCHDMDYMVFKNWWSSGRHFTYLRSIDMYVVGCFKGTGKELIKKAYKDSKISGRNYEKIVKYIESIKKDINKEYKNVNFIKWLFKGIDKSLLFGIIAMVFGISGVLLHGKTYVANIASAIGIVAIVLMINESLIQFKKVIKNEK